MACAWANHANHLTGAAQSVHMVRVTGKRLFAWISLILTVVSFSRVAVLFLEAMATVRDERNADTELLEICARGDARGSVKMRTACLQAQADRASPIVLKAVVRAVSTAWREFSDSVATPFGFATMVLFVISSLLLPVIPWIKAVLTAWAGDDDEYQDDHRDGDLEHHVVVLTGDQSWMPTRPGVRKRMARRLVGTPRIRMVPSNSGSQWGQGDSYGRVEELHQ
jgi:hypothetical protein